MPNTGRPATDDPIGQPFTHFQQGNIPEAEALLQTVLNVDAEQPDALYGLGVVYFETERFSEAAQCLGQLDTLQPGSKDLMLHLANAQALADEPALAVDTYQRLLAIAPETPDIHFNLSVMLSELGRSAEASDIFEVAVDREPNVA